MRRRRVTHARPQASKCRRTLARGLAGPSRSTAHRNSPSPPPYSGFFGALYSNGSTSGTTFTCVVNFNGGALPLGYVNSTR